LTDKNNRTRIRHVLTTCFQRVYYTFAMCFPFVHHKFWTKYALLADKVKLIHMVVLMKLCSLRHTVCICRN